MLAPVHLFVVCLAAASTLHLALADVAEHKSCVPCIAAGHYWCESDSNNGMCTEDQGKDCKKECPPVFDDEEDYEEDPEDIDSEVGGHGADVATTGKPTDGKMKVEKSTQDPQGASVSTVAGHDVDVATTGKPIDGKMKVEKPTQDPQGAHDSEVGGHENDEDDDLQNDEEEEGEHSDEESQDDLDGENDGDDASGADDDQQNDGKMKVEKPTQDPQGALDSNVGGHDADVATTDKPIDPEKMDEKSGKHPESVSKEGVGGANVADEQKNGSTLNNKQPSTASPSGIEGSPETESTSSSTADDNNSGGPAVFAAVGVPIGLLGVGIAIAVKMWYSAQDAPLTGDNFDVEWDDGHSISDEGPTDEIDYI